MGVINADNSTVPEGFHGMTPYTGLPNINASEEGSANKPIDYSDALLVQSNNGKETALAQISSEEFALQQASMDREMKQAADLELGLATFNTKLQTSKLDYFQAMKAESDHHTEKLVSIAADVPSPEGV